MKKSSKKNKIDKIFKKKGEGNAGFVFDKSVVEVFDDMLNRSVPFYQELQRMIVELSLKFSQPNSCIYDLGCSLGNTCLGLAKKIKDGSIRIIGIDNSEEMIKGAINKLNKQRKILGKKRIVYKCDEISDKLLLNNASVVIICLTLQFIRPIKRLPVVENIFRYLKPGGVLILYEKNILKNSTLNRFYIDFYYDFKQKSGYTKTEIAKKRLSLENILIPYTIEENKLLLKKVGFTIIETFFQWYNFSGIIAIKK